MKYLIISFKSRNELYSFARILKSNSIYFSIINTPKQIGSSCTLSIKADFRYLNKISQILNSFNLKTFLGVYSFQASINGDQIFKLM